MKAIKDYFSEYDIKQFSNRFLEVSASFNQTDFLKLATNNLPLKEYRERVEQAAGALIHVYNNQFNVLYSDAREVLKTWVTEEKDLNKDFSVEILSKCIEKYGLDHPKLSFELMEDLTQIFTAEFCIRPFVDCHFQTLRPFLVKWKKSKNHHWRRLVSEGLRPNLPWGKALAKHKKEPLFSIPWLEGLSNDDSEYVRRSVANHLNDFGKSHPEEVLSLIKKWEGNKPSLISEKDKRHALRGLIKAGNAGALELVGVFPFKGLVELDLPNKEIALGESLELNLLFQSQKEQQVEVDMVLDLPAKNPNKRRQLTWKGFKKHLPSSPYSHQLKLPLKPVSTRQYYPGNYFVKIQVNGEIITEAEFQLKL